MFGNNSQHAMRVEDVDRSEVLLRGLGIKTAALKALFATSDHAYRNSHTEIDELSQGYPKIGNLFQKDAVATKCFSVISPFTGALIKTADSVPVPIGTTLIPIVYEFLNDRPFVIGVGSGWAGAISFVWLIKEGIIVTADPGESTWISAEIVISNYVAFCAGNKELLNSYRKKPHDVSLCSGFISNLGHYFWNETSGMERLIRFGVMAQVKKIYAPIHSWIKIEDIFSQDALPDIEAVQDWSSITRSVLENNELLIRSTGTAYDKTLADKVLRACEIVLRRNDEKRFLDLQQQITCAKFVLFVNLRSHNKMWVEQREGVRSVVEMLQAAVLARDEYIPNSSKGDEIFVFLDGYKDCEDEARAISSPDLGRVTFTDGTNVSFAETLYWAFHCDAFMAVIGSGLVPLTWIADKPGVCYSEGQHLRQLAWWRKVRRSDQMLLSPDPATVIDEKDRMYSNFSIDPSLIRGLFLDAIKGIKIYPQE